MLNESTSNVPTEENHPEFLARCQGLINPRDLSKLRESTVAIAGVGGVGGRLAEVLARSGVGQLRLADPDIFTTSNLNRQAGATFDTLGVKKVNAIADLCSSVSPFVEITLIPTGVTPENLENFIVGADVVVDATDYTLPALGAMICSAASAKNIPVVLGVEIAFGAWHTVIGSRHALNRLFGIPHRISIDDLADGSWEIPLWRWITELPPYADLLELHRLTDGAFEAPAVAPAVELSAALLSTSVIHLLLGGKPLTKAPKINFVDAVSGTAKTYRPTKMRFLRSIVRAYWVQKVTRRPARV